MSGSADAKVTPAEVTPTIHAPEVKDTAPLLDKDAGAPLLNKGAAASSNETQDLEKKPPLPGQLKHQCTDVFCLAVFLLGIAGLIATTVYAAQLGDWQRLHHGYDYQGKMCGVDVPEELLFWCTNGEGLDHLHPICVSSCPLDASTINTCFKSTKSGPSTRNVSAYETVPYGGKYCLPTNATLAASVTDWLFAHPVGRAIQQATDFSNGWLLLLAAGGASVVVGYTYLVLIEYMADQVVYSSIFILSVLPIAAGVIFTLMSMYGRDATLHALPWLHGTLGANVTVTWTDDSVLKSFMYGGNSEFHQKTDMAIGVICFVFGSAFLSVLVCARLAIARALAWVEAACDCIFQVPSLLLEPLLANGSKLLVLVGLGAGFVRLLTVGQLAHSERFGGVYFTYSPLQWGLIGFYLFMLWWIAETMTAMSQFVHAYAAQLWYFTPYEGEKKKRVPSFCTLKGYDAALSYHLGSLALGALVIAPFRVPRAIMNFLASQIIASQQHPLLQNDSHACDCVVVFYKSTLEWMSKNAYMDMAVTSDSFFPAARRADKIVTEEAPPVAGLGAGQLVSQMLGLGVITSAGAATAWFLVNSCAATFYPSSPEVVRSPVFFAVCGGIIGLLVAEDFMSLFDTVGDALTYCFAIDHRREGGKLMALKVVRPALPATATQNAGGIFTKCCACCSAAKEEDPEEQRYESVYAPKKFVALMTPGGQTSG